MPSPNQKNADSHSSNKKSPPSPLNLLTDPSTAASALTEEKLAAWNNSNSHDDNASPCSIRSNPLSIQIPHVSPHAVTFAAMQYLPMPVLVLSDLKTVTFVNDAAKRLLLAEKAEAVVDTGRCRRTFIGETLGQLGVDMLQNGRPVWVNWEDFLQSIGEEPDKNDDAATSVETKPGDESGDTTPTGLPPPQPKYPEPASSDSVVHDVAVEVVISHSRCTWVTNDTKDANKRKRASATVETEGQVLAIMIVTAWWMEDVKYYTLTFTSSERSETKPKATTAQKQSSSRQVARAPKPFQSTPSSASTSSSSSGRISGSTSSPPSNVSSPSTMMTSFPPAGPPSRASTYSAPTVLQKATRLRQALLNCLSQPAYAIWQDETVGIPNEALMRLSWPPEGPENDQRDFLARFRCFAEDLSRPWTLQDFPVLQLLQDGKPVEGKRCAIKTPDGQLIIYDLETTVIRDEQSGEMIGGVVILKDVSEYMKAIEKQKKLTASQFEVVAQKIPQMVWITSPTGYHEWFSQRWYDYTGLSEEVSIGNGWELPFHPDDMALTGSRWAHSLATGEEYLTEYRCRRKDGQWRWFLGRALPMRDENGLILKWFGTCTDIHEAVLAREAAKQTREQLLRVVETAQVTLWCVDLERTLTFFEGSLMWNAGITTDRSRSCIGRNVYEFFGTMKGEVDSEFYKAPIEAILAGQKEEETTESQIKSNGRWFRTRFVPLYRTLRTAGVEGASYIDGVIGVSMDVTELRRRESELRLQEKENSQLLNNALAAKEASRLKSQFLANMSHEIRTPIAGVIGMSELLLDMNLDQEQKECADNIQRSANGLLTVINDILDFSKVESGRLDVEEVQFSLSVVLQDVNKMLSFAAERKNLTYESHIQRRVTKELRVLGDPGRLRQILTNLLTNSIKFTSDGRVTLKAFVKEETTEVVLITFVVEDTGIGIEEEVRKKLFTPFSQADSSTARRYGGTGLGLTISKNLVELMHGSIWLESKLGYGTKATFEIPFKKTEFEANASPLLNLDSIPDRLQSDLSISVSSSDDRHTPPITPTEGRSKSAQLGHSRQHSGSMVHPTTAEEVTQLSDSERQNIHVLVVEDNQINQQIALKTIKKLHFSVSAVWNGQEALDYILAAEKGATSPKPDIVLMDCQMPVLDGYRATQFLRTKEPYANVPGLSKLPIIAMTASAIQGDKERCKKAGMDDYLAKPVRGKVLERMLVKWAVERKRQLRNRPVGENLSQSNSSGSNNTSEESPSAGGGLKFATESMLHRSAETENSSAMRRVEAEEKAMSLRDSKLLISAENIGKQHQDHRPTQSSRPPRPSGPTHALTQENISKFVDGQGRVEEPTNGQPKAPQRGTSESSLMVNRELDSRPTSSYQTHVSGKESTSTLTPDDGPP